MSLDHLRATSRTIMVFTASDSKGTATTEDHTHSRNWFKPPTNRTWSQILSDIQPDRNLAGKSGKPLIFPAKTSGGRGIRTPATLAGRPVFKTGADSDAILATPCLCIKNGEPYGAQFGTNPCHCKAITDADLQRLIEIWPTLPESVRRAINALTTLG